MEKLKPKLVAIYREEPCIAFCSHCDEQAIETKKYYKVIEEDNSLSFATYLDCCVKEIGTVVYWYSIVDGSSDRKYNK